MLQMPLVTKLADAADGLQRRVANTRQDRASSISCVEVEQFSLIESWVSRTIEQLHQAFILRVLGQIHS